MFVPAAGVRGIMSSSSTEDFRASLAQIRAGSALYEVFGIDSCNQAPGAPRVPVGTVRTTSSFVASAYGDKALFFRHEEFKQ